MDREVSGQSWLSAPLPVVIPDKSVCARQFASHAVTHSCKEQVMGHRAPDL